MARQKGVIKLEGKIGDLTFFKTKDGFQVREKSGVAGDRIRTDPAFERTRENGAEFGRAGKASKLLRTALRTQLLTGADSRIASRLTKHMLRVIQQDAVNDRGMRKVLPENTPLLKGFEFNQHAPITGTLFASIVQSINRDDGTGSISIAPYLPKQMLVFPMGATHYQFTIAIGAIDFDGETYNVANNKSEMLPLNNLETAPLELTAVLGAGVTDPLFLLLGIEFSQLVNDNYYPLQNGAHNALALVEVNAGV